MTKSVDIQALGTQLPDLVEEAEHGEDVVITRDGRPVARLVHYSVDSDAGDSRDQARETVASYSATSFPPIPESALTHLVATPAMRRVLALFLLDPAVELHQREIARRTGSGLRSVQLAAQRLVDIGLLGTRRDGNRLYYRALRTERFERVRQLLAREFGIAEVIARHLNTLQTPPVWAFIFGSVARGADKIGSDIDLVVIIESSHDDLVRPIAEAQRELGREIDVISYRPNEFSDKRRAGNHFLQSILQQPRIDVVGHDDDA